MTSPESKDPIDDLLRHSLRHVDPPAGFADRVIARASKRGVTRLGAYRPLLPWAAAAVLAVAFTGGLWYRAEERRRAAGEEARRQVLLGLQIAGNKLHAVQMKINRQESQQ